MATQYSKNKLMDSNYVEGDWFLICRHYSGDGDYFSNADDWAEAKQTNVNNPSANKYSNLYLLEKFRRYDKFTMMLKWPNVSSTNKNIWSQTNNPVTDTNGAVDNYTAIDVDYSGSGWGGLERYGSNGFLDGTTYGTGPHSSWWYSVATKNSYGGAGNFPGPGAVTNLVELWVKFKNI